MIYKLCKKTQVGFLTVRCDDSFIISVSFEKIDAADKHPLLKKAFLQLEEYFEGKRREFALPIRQEGTPFQKKVWEELKKIPYGKTVSYEYIAEKVGNKKACRAVGMANNKNALCIIVPCHRVVGKNGKLTGYAFGNEIKEKLLSLEGAI